MQHFDTYQTEAFKHAKGAAMMDETAYLPLKLAGEAGEVAEKIGKLMRDQGVFRWDDIPAVDRVDLLKELGDVLWYVAGIATMLGYPFSTVATLNIEKIQGRQERGTVHGSGDDR